MVLGTPAYMSPEQVRGEPADHRADIFAFGAVLYEMLSGTRAFRRNTPVESMNAVLNDALPELSTTHPNIPLALARIVERCLEKQPDNRFQSAKDLAFAIEAARDKGHPAPGGRQHDTSADSRQRQLVFGIAFLVLLAGGLGWWLVHQFGQTPKPGASSPGTTNSPAPATTSATDQKSIAVLPFVNLSADKSDDSFSDGITYELINALLKVKGLRVPGRGSSFLFKNNEKKQSSQEIGEQLRVNYLLEGSVSKAGTTFRIDAALVTAADGFQLWSTNYDRKTEEDVFAMRSDVAQQVAGALKIQLGIEEARSIAKKPTENAEAYRLYWLLLARRFDEAIVQERIALALDPNSAWAHGTLGWSLLWKGDKVGALKGLQQQQTLDPDPWAIGCYGYALAVSGDRAKAEQFLRDFEDKAKQRYVTPAASMVVYIGLGEKEKALEWLEKSYADRDPRLAFLKVEPIYDSLRNEPRFQAVLKKVGLDK